MILTRLRFIRFRGFLCTHTRQRQNGIVTFLHAYNSFVFAIFSECTQDKHRTVSSGFVRFARTPFFFLIPPGTGRDKLPCKMPICVIRETLEFKEARRDPFGRQRTPGSQSSPAPRRSRRGSKQQRASEDLFLRFSEVLGICFTGVSHSRFVF